MFDCEKLYEDNKSKHKKRQYIQLQKQGIVNINLKEELFDAGGIVKALNDIDYVIKTYKRACKKIIFVCNKFQPADKLTYILLETIIYDLIINKGYDVVINLRNCRPGIDTEGINDSSILHINDLKNNIGRYKRKFAFEQSKTHFRRLLTKEQSEGIGMSTLLGELKTFFLTSDLKKENTDQLAEMISELVDNVGDHTEADCLIDIDISQSNYKKVGDETGEYIAVNAVVFNLGDKRLCDDVREKIENHYFDKSDRYELVETAYNSHKSFFDKNYNEEDFFNIVSFQDGISGRKGETATGGTGLTQLMKSLEANADDHGCYVMSGNRGLFFLPELLEYNEDNWLGFNQQKDFLTARPDAKVLLKSNAFICGTAYNFTLIYRRDM